MISLDFITANVTYVREKMNDLRARIFYLDRDYQEVEKKDGTYYALETRWVPTEEERAAIADGGCISLTLMVRGCPPMRMEVIKDGRIVE